MMVRKNLTVLFLIVVFYLSGFSSLTPVQSSDFKFDMSEVSWNSLSFKSDNFFGTATTRATLAEVAVDEIERLLIASPQSAVLNPPGTKILIITINSAIDPLIGSDELLVTRLWFTPQETTALQRIRLRKGKEKWKKTYRWTEDGVYRLRLKPKGTDEEHLPLERWTDIENSFYAYDWAQCKCGTVSAPSALLYIVSAAGLTVGDQPLSICVFNKKQLHRVKIRAEKHQFLEVNYLEKSGDRQTRRVGKIEVIKISITSSSLFADERKTEAFSFLGMKGDFDIYIKKHTRLPVQVSGKIPKAGKMEFQLDEVGLR